MKKIIKILFIIPGFFLELFRISKKGANDLFNKLNYKHIIIGKGTTIDNKSVLFENSRVLENCILNNVTINSYSYVGRNSLVQNTTIGKYCSIANDVMIGLGKHPIDKFSTSPIFYKVNNTFKISAVKKDLDFKEYEHIIIQNDVWIGAKSIILDGVNIGNGAIVASGSVVTKDVPAYAIVGGIPAKVIKYRFNEEEINKLQASKWWDKKLNEIVNTKLNN